MSFETATSFIEKHFDSKRTSDSKEVVVPFMGREPFLCFDLIRQVTDWMFARKWPLPFVLTSTTNGTLLTRERKDWLKLHRAHFCLSLSYDGTNQSQDINRSSSASSIDLEFFFLSFNKVSKIKATVSEEIVPYIADGIIDLTNRGFVVNANVAHGMPPLKKKSFAEFSRQLDLLVDYYLKKRSSAGPSPLGGTA